MNEWKEEPLEKLTLFIKDGTHGTHRDYENGIPLLSAKDIVDGKVLIPEDCRRISKNDYDKIHSNYEIQENDLVLTIVGTIGRAAIIKNKQRKFTFQRSVGIFRVDPLEINPDYCYHYFTSNQFQQSLERSKNASAQGGVYLGELAKIKISYPKKLLNQRHISNILNIADGVIEKTQVAIAKYKAIKQGMLHDLFTRGIEITTGKLRPKYEDAPELYKDSKLGMVPMDWGTITIEEFAMDTKNAIVDGPFGSNLKTIHYRKSGIPIIQSGFVTSNTFLAENYLYVDNDTFQSEIRSKVTPGDIIMAKIGAHCGTCAILPDNHPVAILAGNCLKITVSKINSNKFLETYLHFLYETKAINNIISTTAQPAVSMSSLKVMRIKYPKPEEQFEIVNRINIMNEVIQTEQICLHKLQQSKAGLMGDLLSGRKSVTTKEEKMV